jgi:hypothetical protein
MFSKAFKSPLIGTFIGAFVANFIIWFVINVIVIGSDYGNFFDHIVASYSHPQGIATGVVMPIFMAGLTAGVVYLFVKIRSALAERKGLRTAAQTGLVLAYLPASLFGLFGIMYLTSFAM